MSSSGGDETYLEAIVESLSTLPSELKRNMELLKDLDGSTSVGIHQLVQLQQSYLQQAEQKLMQLEIVVQAKPSKKRKTSIGDGTDAAVTKTGLKSNEDDKDDTMETKVGKEGDAAESTPSAKGTSDESESDLTTTKVGVRVVSTGDMDEDDPRRRAVVIPTILELQQYIDDPKLHQQIQQLQDELLQKSNLKVAVSNQVQHRINAIVERLDRDLSEMEKLLQSSGDLAIGMGAAGGSASSSSALASKVNDLAACQVSPGSEWILAKVLHHDPNTGMYQLADEDIESNKIFHLPENQVVRCGVDKLSKGDVIFAVYPDTTSFYQATVVQAPRKNAIAQGGSASASLFAMVNFVDDSDEYGITHDKAIPLKHIIFPPFGAALVK